MRNKTHLGLLLRLGKVYNLQSLCIKCQFFLVVNVLTFTWMKIIDSYTEYFNSLQIYSRKNCLLFEQIQVILFISIVCRQNSSFNVQISPLTITSNKIHSRKIHDFITSLTSLRTELLSHAASVSRLLVAAPFSSCSDAGLRFSLPSSSSFVYRRSIPSRASVIYPLHLCI